MFILTPASVSITQVFCYLLWRRVTKSVLICFIKEQAIKYKFICIQGLPGFDRDIHFGNIPNILWVRTVSRRACSISVFLVYDTD